MSLQIRFARFKTHLGVKWLRLQNSRFLISRVLSAIAACRTPLHDQVLAPAGAARCRGPLDAAQAVAGQVPSEREP